MTTYIQRAINDVHVEADAHDQSEPQGDRRWDAEEQARSFVERCKRIKLRTDAWGFND